jgi:hypothetical protein
MHWYQLTRDQQARFARRRVRPTRVVSAGQARTQRALHAGQMPSGQRQLSVGRQAWANSQDLWIGVSRDLLITTL